MTTKIAQNKHSQPENINNHQQNNNVAKHNKKVKNSTLFPRCEFYQRFENTSIFPNDINRAHVYTRSEGARYAQGEKKKDGRGVKFIPTPLTNALNKVTNSLSAHTGGFANPYVLSKYSKNIELNKHQFDPKHQIESKLYDELLTYKLGLCNHVATEFEKQIPHADLGGSRYRAKIISSIPTIDDFQDIDIIIRKYKSGKTNYIALYTIIDGTIKLIGLQNNQTLVDRLWSIRVGSNQQLERLLKEFQPYLISKNLYPNRDMQGVYCSNNYPCILVRFTPKITDKSVTKGELETIYKRYNHLLMAYFIAIVDYNAYKAGIDIEMVGRSGFGQNNPSIAVTDKSFRINIGLVPKAYADIIVQSLVQLHNLFKKLETTSEQDHLKIDAKLKAILNKGREVGFDKKQLPDTYWKSLWEKGSHGKTGRIMLHELLERERDRPELLANFVLQAIVEKPEEFFTNPCIAESPLEEMFNLVKYVPDEKSTKNKSKPFHISVETKEKLKEQPYFDFTKPSDRKVNEDPEFYTIIKKLCSSLDVDLPVNLKISELYRFLEAEHIDFICKKRTRTSKELDEIPEWGSDSEVEEQNFVNNKSIHAKKVIIANGMLAINLAYYAARSVLYLMDTAELMANDSDMYYPFDNYYDEMSLYSRKITVNCNNTYFETLSGDPGNPLCLDVATNPPIQRKNSAADILFFDLNSFKANFIAQKADLESQLKLTQPSVVVLDHTSSTTSEIRNAIKTVLQNDSSVKMVLLVTSGLKNEQGGGDNNPYGKVTLLSLADKGEKNTLTNFIYDEITNLTSPNNDIQLNKKALLPKAAHAVRHSYKDRGFATTTHAILHEEIDDMLVNLSSETEILNRNSGNNSSNNLDNINYMLNFHDIQQSYSDEFEKLVNIGLSNWEIFKLYKYSTSKFVDMSSSKVLDLVEYCEDPDLFEQLSDIYDEDEQCFWDIINDDNELVYNHGISEVYDTYTRLVKKCGHEDSECEENDIIGMVYRRLDEGGYDNYSGSESYSHSDSAYEADSWNDSTENGTEESDTISYSGYSSDTATESSEALESVC
ncbi:MAG: hypothetical protein ACK5Z5_06825 [Neisseriaceae bacterium]